HAAARTGDALAARPAGSGSELSRGWGRHILGLVHYEWDDAETARDHFAAALAHAHEVASPLRFEATPGPALPQPAPGRREEGGGGGARLVDQARRTVRPAQLALLEAFRVRLALLDGEVAPAERWLRTTPATPPGVPPGPVPVQAVEVVPFTWTWARLAAGQGDPSGDSAGRGAAEGVAVTDCLAALGRTATVAHDTRRTVAVLALSALASAAQGRPDAALDTLERALVLGAPGGFVRTF